MNRTRSRSRSPIRRDRQRKEKRPVDAHNDKMVYLNNLPFDLKWNELKDLIRKEVGESAYVEFLEDNNGKFKGAAVLDFDSRSVAQKAVEVLHRFEVRGRNISAKEIRDPIGFFRKIKNDIGIDFLANRQVLGQRGTNTGRRRDYEDPGQGEGETYGLSPSFLQKLNIKLPLVNRIFVSNISYSCGVGQLYDIFSLAGKITWFDLQLDNEGKSKGMAVIQYSHAIEAVQAISMLNNQRVFDRTISVKSDRFEKHSERPPGELPMGLRGVGMGLGANGAPLANVESVLSSLTASSITPVQPQPQIQPFTQSLLNANPFGSQPTTQQFLSQPLQPIQQQPQQQQQPTMNTFSSANDSLSFGQQPQQISQQQPSSFQQQSNGYYSNNPQMTNTPGLSSGNYNNPSNSYSKMSSSVGNSGFGGPTQNKSFYEAQATRIILIKNLPLDYTWQIVHDRVQKFGELENVEIVSPGVAKVRFLRVQDAQRTKDTLSGTTVEGRVIGVEFL